MGYNLWTIYVRMAKAKGITTRTVRLPTKVTPVWQIGIIFPNGNKIMKSKCTLNEIFLTYFLDLEKYLSKGYPKAIRSTLRTFIWKEKTRKTKKQIISYAKSVIKSFLR